MHVRVALKPVPGSMYDQSVMSWTAPTPAMVPGSSLPEKRPRSPVLSTPPLEPAGPQMFTTRDASDQTFRKSQLPSETKPVKATVPACSMVHTQFVLWSGGWARPNVSPRATAWPAPSLPARASLSATPLSEAPHAVSGAAPGAWQLKSAMKPSWVTEPSDVRRTSIMGAVPLPPSQPSPVHVETVAASVVSPSYRRT